MNGIGYTCYNKHLKKNVVINHFAFVSKTQKVLMSTRIIKRRMLFQLASIWHNTIQRFRLLMADISFFLMYNYHFKLRN